MDLQLARALANPLRLRILDTLAEGTASPEQLAASLDQSLSRVSYHTAILANSGCIRVAETRQERAAVEHVYELTPVASSGYLTRRQVSDAVRGHVSASVLQTIMDRGVVALESGTLDARDDSHLSCMPLALDEEGWKEVTAIMDETLDRLAIAHEASAQRIAVARAKAIEATVIIASFESPKEPEEPADGG